MTKSIFDRFSSTDTASVQRKQKQGRILRIEELENRELLSATMLETGLPVADTDTQVIVSSASASAPVLEAPTGLTATDVTPVSAVISWNPVEGATSYRVEYQLRDAFRPELHIISDLTETSVSISGLRSNTAYTFWVYAVIDDY